MISRLRTLLKALRQLGFAPLARLALYRLGLRLGWFRLAERGARRTARRAGERRWRLRGACVHLPTRAGLYAVLGEDGVAAALASAEEIVVGRYRPFCGEPAPLRLDLGLPRAHWTNYERGAVKIPYDALSFPHPDIKFVWEPARFGWAFILGRAYCLSGDGRYASAFWRYFEEFDAANPPYLGPQWMSGQEVALRLMALVWVGAIFAKSDESTPARRARLAAAVAEHADRILPTLLYARAQNNNHLLSEAAGLYTAALALPDHPRARRWRRLGVKWLRWGFANQFDAEGEYIQHSVTYHRLALQVGLWVAMLIAGDTKPSHGGLCSSSCPSWLTFPLAAATRWLAALVDLHNGDAPNLGSNDGAYIFPLAPSGYRDFRPVVQASARAFLGADAFPPGPWNEMSLWFGLGKPAARRPLSVVGDQLSGIKGKGGWAYLRAPHGDLRLAHADPLHLDLWWRGLNITLDPGTYLYNGASPWDNPWPVAVYHNTVTLNGLDPMTRAGRFLYLDWAQARLVERGAQHLVAEHDGYRKLGYRLRRAVTAHADGRWVVEDSVLPLGGRPAPVRARLHWLLPDWEVQTVDGGRGTAICLWLLSPHGRIEITVRGRRFAVSLLRAGEPLLGLGAPAPTRGWYSPTYGVKIPALSFALQTPPATEATFTTTFHFP